jgi:hypothetical protein
VNVKEQLSLLEAPMPAGAAPVWDALDTEQRALVVSMLVRLIARAVGATDRTAPTDGEKSHD